MGFFDSFPMFFESSTIGASPSRLNKRFEIMIAVNRKRFHEASVLDLGSHDGRWSFAALLTGARHVTGVEPRAGLVAKANATFSKYGMAKDKYSFIVAEAFEFLARPQTQFDVVMCLGLLYHSWRHPELIGAICALKPRCIIIDTQITRESSDGCVLELYSEIYDHDGNAVADMTAKSGKTVVARPSRASLRFLLDHFGYEMSEVAVDHFCDDVDGLPDYIENSRRTFVAVPAT